MSDASIPSNSALAMDNAQSIKQAYYAKTSQDFDQWHIGEDDEHYISLKFISAMIPLLEIDSVLDVGAGTGRGVMYFRQNHPNVRAHGVEPSPDMRGRAVEKGIPEELITLGRGEKLPFPDQSFDAITEFGVVHHIQDPDAAVREMMRVARKAIFLSDGNRFAGGSAPRRWFKLLSHKVGLWPLVNLIKTRGKGYDFTGHDGLSYSYSPYDQHKILAKWADRVIMIPTGPEVGCTTWLHPLLSSSQMLYCALRHEKLTTKNRS